MGWIHNTNAAVARSAVGRYFRLEGSGHVSDTDLDEDWVLTDQIPAQRTS
jgi:hypothetical protein